VERAFVFVCTLHLLPLTQPPALFVPNIAMCACLFDACGGSRAAPPSATTRNTHRPANSANATSNQQTHHNYLFNATHLQWFSSDNAQATLPEDTPKHVVVNGMSRNTGMRWDLSDTEKYLGYAPIDDSGEDAKYWAAK
jgi:hypothetical protein